MSGGLLQLVVIGLIVMASLFDASTRGRRRRERMQRREEADADAAADATRGDQRMTSPGTGRSERERTAESMIPADLWEVLTGEKRAPSREREPEPQVDEAPAWSAEEGPYQQPYEPPPMPEYQAPAEPETEPAWSTAEGSYDTYVAQPPAEEAPQVPVVTWPSMHPEGAALQRPAPPLRHPAATRKARPTASDYTELLRAHDARSLREAMVVSEVLGPPIALRRPDDQG